MSIRHGIRRDGLALDLAVGIVALLIALALSEFIHAFLGTTRVSLVFLAAVTVTASLRGSRAALVTALAGVLFYRLFLELRVGESTDVVEDVLNIVIFLIVALVTGALAGRIHDEAIQSQIRAERMESLFTASRTLSDEDEETFWPAVSTALSDLFGGTTIVLDDEAAVRGRCGEPTNYYYSYFHLCHTILH